MKKHLLVKTTVLCTILVAILSFALTSCTKEKTTQELIIGSWINTSKSYVENNDGGILHRYPFAAGERFYEFKSDGTGIYLDNGVSNGWSFTYTISDNKIYFDGDNEGWEIIEISELKLIIEQTSVDLGGLYYETLHFEFDKKN